MLHVVNSQSAMEREKAGFWQTQVRFERLLQETGAVRPRGMHFCYPQDVLADISYPIWSIMHTAHGGQLAIFVGSPVVFVAWTATADKAIDKKAETERIVLVL